MRILRTISKWLLPSAKFGYNMLATSAEVFCRHSFGRRYAPRLIGSFFTAFVFLSLFRCVVPQLIPGLIDIYLLSHLALTLYHIARAWRQGANIHSYSSGQSWGVWPGQNANSNFVPTVIEPLIHTLAGVLLLPLNPLLSLWLLLGGASLFIKESLASRQFRNRVLDSVDARLEGERLAAGVRQQTIPRGGREQPANQVTAGGAAQPPPDNLRQIFSRLDPALQRLVTPPNPNHQCSARDNQPNNPQVVVIRQDLLPRRGPVVPATPPTGNQQGLGANDPNNPRVVIRRQGLLPRRDTALPATQPTGDRQAPGRNAPPATGRLSPFPPHNSKESKK
jgi:hypothetical protein